MNRGSALTAETSALTSYVLRLVSNTDDFANWDSCYRGLTEPQFVP